MASQNVKPGSVILLTGATGYVGGRLLEQLTNQGYPVRCLARRPEFLQPRVGRNTEVIKGDCLDGTSLVDAMKEVHTAFYLVHSMGSAGSFEEEDRQAAANFSRAAAAAGVQRIIYLGGLGDSAQTLSAHLKSRQEVGAILRGSGVSVIEFRASIIIGSGSLSYEMIRTLVERLPVMICPAWVKTKAQPIGIEDVIEYLTLALDLPLEIDATFEIGGPEQLSYGELMEEYARQRGLRRWMIPVPVLTPRLSSLWLGLVTPLYSRVGRKLIDSLRNPSVIRDSSALATFPIKPRGVREAIQRALHNEDREFATTRWSDALSSSGRPAPWGGARFGSRLIDSRVVAVGASPARAFGPIQRIGGDNGWYYGAWLWRLRGFLDLLVGGAGLRRGRRDPEHLRIGDTLDFWRVEDIEQNKRLRLAAEMKLPGRAWLEFEVIAGNPTEIRQTAIFDPLGLWGLAYWYALYPVHQLIFAGMLRVIAETAEEEQKTHDHRTQP